MPRHQTVIALMGPTASGKTALAIALAQRFPLQIISVDSAMVYRGMDIGTAKPTADILEIAPHRLINICDPSEPYSAGQFVRDAQCEIAAAFAAQKIPLLVGGTMLYFRALQQGLAALPVADAELRRELTARAEKLGWDHLHRELMQIDPMAAQHIESNDAQRIQRALEVFYLTGQPLSQLQQVTQPLQNYQFVNIGLMPSDRKDLQQKIATRFDAMVEGGLIEEARQLYLRGDLSPELPAMRCVGYRQLWDYFAGLDDFTTAREKAIIATRQLAKRQMTWLRRWPEISLFDPRQEQLLNAIAIFFTQPF